MHLYIYTRTQTHVCISLYPYANKSKLDQTVVSPTKAGRRF